MYLVGVTSKSSFTASRKTAIVAFSLLAIMLTDIYLLPAYRVTEVFDFDSVETSRSTSSSHKTYFIYAKSKNRYNVPESVYYAIPTDRKFFAFKTCIFRRNTKIGWCSENSCAAVLIGTFNSTYFADIVTGTLLVLLGLISFGVKSNWLIKWTYGLAGFGFGAFVFYLIY